MSLDPVQMYIDGDSLVDVSKKTGIAVSTLRFRMHKLGVLRSPAEGIRLAGKRGKMDRSNIKREPVDENGRANMRAARKRWADQHATGFSVKPNGYIEHTMGPHKERCVHVTLMEERLGRALLPDECVHHIDGDRRNNNINNLALVTRSGHSRLHRYEEALSGQQRERDENGRFC